MNTFTKAGLVAIALVFAQSATSVAFAATSNLPPLHQQGVVTYLSGGVGSDQSAALKDVMHKYPLVLEFAGATRHGNEYLADVPVHIADMNGKTLLNATSHGPFILASLPNGRYKITASHDGKTQQRLVDIKSSGHVRAMFVWPTHPEGSTS
ncbi:hypothetical protein SAMN05445504_7964 [Burkholderia sp. CF099]|jgi:hypothetical protein|nr:hypothetical protein SAMN05445504_7964 [Burkholderia sp. CF099]